MRIGNKKFELNKWQFVAIFEKRPPTMCYGFRPWIVIRFCKVHTRPPEGERLQKKHYKGFLLEFMIPTDNMILEVTRFHFYKLKVPCATRIYRNNFNIENEL